MKEKSSWEHQKMKSSNLKSMESTPLGWGNRGWFEIIYSIVTESWDGSLKTHLMNKCNLNSRQVENYLHFLLERRLLTYQRSHDSTRAIYKTTELGRKYIEVYKHILEFFSTPPWRSDDIEAVVFQNVRCIMELS